MLRNCPSFYSLLLIKNYNDKTFVIKTQNQLTHKKSHEFCRSGSNVEKSMIKADVLKSGKYKINYRNNT